MEETNKVLAAAITREITGTALERFSRIVKLYGYTDKNKNLLEFLTLAVDNPQKFKNTSLILSKWKTVSSIQNTFGTLNRVYEIPEVHEAIGPKLGLVVVETKAYINHLLAKVKDNPEPHSAPGSVTSSDDIEHRQGQDVANQIRLCTELQDLKNRLLMYCGCLNDIDNDAAKAISKIIRHDVERYLA